MVVRKDYLDEPARREIAARRLVALRLSGEPCSSPQEVVGWLAAVQAQDFGPAKWAIAQRTHIATEADLDRTYAAGHILRTHLLRPTWHFVLPADIHWLLTATAVRVAARTAHRMRQLDLDERTLARAADVISGALEGNVALTRRELAAALTAAGIACEGQRLPYVLMYAELDARLCSGPPRGAQHTYVALATRVPEAHPLDRDEALAELAGRYFRSHGPATDRDFAGWASLTLAEARRGREAARLHLQRDVFADGVYWSHQAVLAGSAPASSPASAVRLLHSYDEYIMGYTESKHVLVTAGSTPAATPSFSALVVMLGGRLAGYWRRRTARGVLGIEVDLNQRLDEERREALVGEARRYAAYAGASAVKLTTFDGKEIARWNTEE